MKPTILKGWDLPREEFAKAHKQSKLTTLSVDLTDLCNLECKGCFTKKERQKRIASGIHERDMDYYQALIDEAKELGVQSVDFVGAGEPTLDKNFWNIIQYLNEKEINPIVFTNGITLNDNDKVKRLYDSGASVFIKLWSFDQTLQDNYTSKGYAEKRDKALELLIEQGFNKGEEKEINSVKYKTSRLGADILVRRSNLDEIPDLFRYCRKNNIMPEIKCYIPTGTTPEDEVFASQYLELREKLAKIDKEEFGIEMPMAHYPQACDCTQSIGGLYVMLSGDVKGCVGTEKILSNSSLAEALKNRSEPVGFGCRPRLAYQKKHR